MTNIYVTIDNFVAIAFTMLFPTSTIFTHIHLPHLFYTPPFSNCSLYLDHFQSLFSPMCLFGQFYLVNRVIWYSSVLIIRSFDHHNSMMIMWLELWFDEHYSLWAHLTGSGSESSLPEVSSVVASGRIVVISIGMESTAPSATRRQPRNFSISPAEQ